jgi:hypothetical protein
MVEFPFGMVAVGPLVSASLQANSANFVPLWAGQGVSLGEPSDAANIVARLAGEAVKA